METIAERAAVRIEAQQVVAEPVDNSEGSTPPTGPAPPELAAFHEPQGPLAAQPLPLEFGDDRPSVGVGDRDLPVAQLVGDEQYTLSLQTLFDL